MPPFEGVDDDGDEGEREGQDEEGGAPGMEMA